jgi:hypothetical protein
MEHHDEVGMHPDASMMNHQVGELSEGVLEENEHGEEQSSLMDLDCQPAGELREGAVEDLEKQHYLALHAKFGGGVAAEGQREQQDDASDNASEASSVGIHRPQKKREQKVHDKEQENQSVKSGESQHSKISRSTTGRFEAKYKVGDRTAGGAIIKEVIESDWEFLEKDKKGNKYYKCLHCERASRVMKSDRRTHNCKTK